jgi:hypothetical protein
VAEVDVVIGLGSSVERGLGSLLSAVPGADLTRWFGTTYDAAVLAGYPVTVPMPGTKWLTPKMPFPANVQRAITTGAAAGGNTLVHVGVAADALPDSWALIKTNTTGQGLVKRVVTNIGGGPATLTIVGTWGTAVGDNGTVVFISNSHTVTNPVTVVIGPTTYTVSVDRTANTTTDFTTIVGKLVAIAGTERRVVASLIFNGVTYMTDANTMVFDDPIGSAVAADTMFIVLDGAGSAETLATIATNAVLQPLQIALSNLPVLLTGYDYPNYDLQPGFAAPSISAATINANFEMAAQLRARFPGTIYGLDVQRDSSTLSPYPIGTSLRLLLQGWQHDLTQFDFHPSGADSLYSGFIALVAKLRDLIIAEGNTPRWRFFKVLLAENDQILSQGGEVRHASIGKNLAILRDAVREVVGDPTMAFLAIGPGSRDYPLQGVDSSAYSDIYDSVYEQLEQLVMEDTYTEFVDLRDTDRYEFVVDALHLTSPSEINLGVDTALAYDRVVAGTTASDVDICNLALSHIGESAKVTSLDTTIDTSAQARHCARFYPLAVDQLLEMHSWDFATRRTELVPLSSDAYTRTEWTYAYEAPVEMAGAIAVLAPDSANDAPTQPFIKEADAAGRTIIYTDVQNAVIRYNRYVSNTRKFSRSFVRALSWLLASDLAGPIVKGAEGKKAAADCLAMLKAFLGEAKKHDSNQRKTEHAVEAPWMPGGEMPSFPRRWDPNGHA